MQEVKLMKKQGRIVALFVDGNLIDCTNFKMDVSHDGFDEFTITLVTNDWKVEEVSDDS